MKPLFSKFILGLLFFLSSISLAQSNPQEIRQDIDVSLPVRNSEVSINKGDYTFYITKVRSNATYDYKVIKERVAIEPIDTPDGFGVLRNGEIFMGKYSLNKGEQLQINITETHTVKDPKDATKTITTITNFEYIYTTGRRGEWRTTFGFNFIHKINQDTYFSSDNGNSTYTITEARNRDKFDYHPTLMFTWLGNKTYGKNDNWQFGWSGGIGYDLEESLSIFLGKSVIYNENITLTFGLAFHNQQRLSSQYSEGNIINEDLNFDQLHTEYIRLNPFISLSFRLDRNPFGG